MKAMNLGCASDYKEGWTNVDRLNFGSRDQKVFVWDATKKPLKSMLLSYDFVLINHVLCTMDYRDVGKVLDNVREILRPGGSIQVIDLNLWTAIDAYQRDDAISIPAGGKTIDEMLCNHISGYGTRKSLFTPKLMVQLLQEHGFQNAAVLSISEHDLRPSESLIVEAQR